MFGIFFMIEKGKVTDLIEEYPPDIEWNIVDRKTLNLDIICKYLSLIAGCRKTGPQLFATASRGDVTKIYDLDDISHFESNGRLMTIKGNFESFEFYGRLKNIEKALSDHGFIRISNCCVASRNHVRIMKNDYVDFGNADLIKMTKKYKKQYFIRLN